VASGPRKRNFSIRAAKSQLLNALMSARKNELAMYRDLRDAGLAWIDICAWLDDPGQHGGKRMSASKWAKENAPFDKKWLDEHARFARGWDEFLVTWKWAQEAGYSPERRPGLRTAFDLMDSKKRADTYTDHYGGRTARTPVRADAVAERNGRVVVSPLHDVLVGDVVEMTRQYVGDESVDLITCDGPWFLRMPEHKTRLDYIYEQSKMRPRFEEEWDRFDSIEAYEDFSSRWIDEAMRCLKPDGSLFAFASFHNLPLIARLLQLKGINIVQHIQVVRLNGRPCISQQTLQHSHYTIIWATKSGIGYRFNEHQTKMAAYDNDPFNNRRGVRKRDIWSIPNIHQTGAHPAAKSLDVFWRLFDLAGVPGGHLLDLFAGHGPAASTAARWGMRSTSIEKNSAYAAEIARRLQTEMDKAPPLERANRRKSDGRQNKALQVA
jgi:DNA modification methylase